MADEDVEYEETEEEVYDDVPGNERLAQIWREGRKHAVITFLKRAITPEATLRDVFDALAFHEAHEHLDDLRLQDILSHGGHGTITARPKAAGTHVRGKLAPHTASRDPELTQHMRDRLVDFLVESNANRATTPELFAALREDGLATAQVAVVSLIKGLEQEGVVQNCGGSPIVWKLLT